MTSPAPAFSFRSVAAAVYLPTLLFSIGEGALIPLIPSVATDLGASLALAGMIAAMLTIGELIGDIPSGLLVSRVGERTSMIGAVGLTIIAVVVIMMAPNTLVLALGILLLGLATAVFALARHAFMTSYVPARYRARALSLLGGVFRAGVFIGPLLSAPIIHLTGDLAGVYWTMVVFCLAAAVVLLVLPDPERLFGEPARVPKRGAEETAPTTGAVLARRETNGLGATLRRSWRVLATVGVGASIISALRAARAVILPLWAVSLGLNASSTSLIIGIAGAVEFALFYASGQIMDRFGRMWAALPSLIGLGGGMVLLSVTHDLHAAVTWLWIAAIVLGVSNGLSSGIIMTLGADLADRADPAPFLGAWRFVVDTGSAASPLLIAGITAIASLSIAAGSLGALAAVGVVVLARWLPGAVPHRRP